VSWNNLLLHHSEFWEKKTEAWRLALNEAFKSRKVFVFSSYTAYFLTKDPGQNIQLAERQGEVLYKSVVMVLRELRHVQPRIYQSTTWRRVVRVSILNILQLFLSTIIYIITEITSGQGYISVE